jgi:hypothetical protein
VNFVHWFKLPESSLLLLYPSAFPNFSSSETSLCEVFCTSIIQPKLVLLEQEIISW